MAEVIMRAAKCGHHFHDDCISCQSALECTNREMDELRAKAQHLEAENRRLRRALEPFANPPLYVFDKDQLFVPAPHPRDWIGGGLFSTEDFRRARTALEGKEQGHG